MGIIWSVNIRRIYRVNRLARLRWLVTHPRMLIVRRRSHLVALKFSYTILETFNLVISAYQLLFQAFDTIMRCSFIWQYFRADSTKVIDHYTVSLQMFSQLIFIFHFCRTVALKWAGERLLFTVKDMSCVVFVSKGQLALFAEKLGFFEIRHHMSINFG